MPGEWWDESWKVAVGCNMSCIKDDEGRWTGEVRLWGPELEAPLHWRKPQVVAVSLMGDLWHDSVPLGDIFGIYFVMARCPQHRFVVLTKRAQRRCEHYGSLGSALTIPDLIDVPFPLPNVIEMVSASTQAELDERWPWLAKTPAARRGLDLEPLLEPVDLDSTEASHAHVLGCGYEGGWQECPDLRAGRTTEGACRGVDWVVVDGETGPDARPMHPDWVRSIRDDCAAAGVPFWFKSHGEWLHETLVVGEAKIRFALGRLTEPKRHTWPDGSVSWRVGHKAAGRLLDGREHNGVPW